MPQVHLVILRDENNGIDEVFSDNPNVVVTATVIDRDLRNADPVFVMQWPDGSESSVDRWSFTASYNPETVQAALQAQPVGAAVEPELVAVPAVPAPVVPVDGDNPNCDYCGEFVGLGLRVDFPKLTCAGCDSI